MTTEKESSFFILFVDDEDQVRKYFAKGLEKYYHTLTAASIDEAKAIIAEKHNEIALVITDQRMPGGNGVKLLQYLRDTHPKIIRMLATGYSDVTDAIECINNGEILRYIKKPWDYDMLRHEVKQALDIFELRLERDQLVNEKIMIKRKMIKMDRVRQVVLLARAIKYIRFSDITIQSFIEQFANAENENQEREWVNYELGNEDLAETLFLLEMVEKVSKKIPFNQNYRFDKALNATSIEALIDGIASEQNVSFIDKIITDIGDITVNEYGLKTAINELLANISRITKDLQIKVTRVEDSQITIMIQSADYSHKESSNIFFVPSSKRDQIEVYVNLLVCYLLIGHHGGRIEVKTDKTNIKYSIYLPINPKNAVPPRKFSHENLDDMFMSILVN